MSVTNIDDTYQLKNEDSGSTTTDWLNSEKMDIDELSCSDLSTMSMTIDGQNFLDEIPHFPDQRKPNIKAISSE